MSEWNWREHWQEKTKGGHEVLFVAVAHDGLRSVYKRADSGETFTAGHRVSGSHYTDPTIDLVCIVPPAPRLTASDLLNRGAILRVKDTVGPFGITIGREHCAIHAGAYSFDSAEPATFCIPDPTKTASEQDWRPLSEVDLTK